MLRNCCQTTGNPESKHIRGHFVFLQTEVASTNLLVTHDEQLDVGFVLSLTPVHVLYDVTQDVLSRVLVSFDAFQFRLRAERHVLHQRCKSKLQYMYAV